jgi:hypothetical protein
MWPSFIPTSTGGGEACGEERERAVQQRYAREQALPAFAAYRFCLPVRPADTATYKRFAHLEQLMYWPALIRSGLQSCTRVQLPHLYVAPSSSAVPQPSSPPLACLGCVSLCVPITTAHTGVSGRQANQRTQERCNVGRPARRTCTIPMRMARQRGTPAWAWDEDRRSADCICSGAHPGRDHLARQPVFDAAHFSGSSWSLHDASVVASNDSNFGSHSLGGDLQ